MLGCGCARLSCLLAVTLIHCGVDSFRLTQETPELRGPAALEESGNPARPGEEKLASDLAEKLLLLDRLVHLENDVMETKRKRSFPGGNTPLDRLSVGTMEIKAKQRKVVEPPRRRVSVPIDRIGMGRLPSNRG